MNIQKDRIFLGYSTDLSTSKICV